MARTHETCPLRLASTYTVAQLHEMGEQTGRSLAAATDPEWIAFGQRLCHSIWMAIMLRERH